MDESGPQAENKEKLKKRILIADDEEAILFGLVSLLEDEGYKVDAVENGQLLLEQLRKENYDLVITDNNMPVLNGLEALKQIRDDARFSNLPVIVNSAKGTRETIDTVESLGGVFFLKSGSPNNIFFGKIKDLLSNSKQ